MVNAEPPTPKDKPTIAALRARSRRGFLMRLDWPPIGWKPGTARAQQYRLEAVEWLKEAPLPDFTAERLQLTIVVNVPDGRQLKPWSLITDAVLDVLLSCGAIRHLSQIAEINLKRGAPGRPGYLDLWIKPLASQTVEGA